MRGLRPAEVPGRQVGGFPDRGLAAGLPGGRQPPVRGRQLGPRGLPRPARGEPAPAKGGGYSQPFRLKPRWITQQAVTISTITSG